MSRGRATDGALHEQAVPYRAGAGEPTPVPRLTCLDLFCGCGGFSLGMQRAGFSVLAAIDSNAEAIATFDQNFPDVPFILQKDLTSFGPEAARRVDLAKLLCRHSRGCSCRRASLPGVQHRPPGGRNQPRLAS